MVEVRGGVVELNSRPCPIGIQGKGWIIDVIFLSYRSSLPKSHFARKYHVLNMASLDNTTHIQIPSRPPKILLNHALETAP
jgi:hypothetical protein